jgi:hypothetical protein
MYDSPVKGVGPKMTLPTQGNTEHLHVLDDFMAVQKITTSFAETRRTRGVEPLIFVPHSACLSQA